MCVLHGGEITLNSNLFHITLCLFLNLLLLYKHNFTNMSSVLYPENSSSMIPGSSTVQAGLPFEVLTGHHRQQV